MVQGKLLGGKIVLEYEKKVMLTADEYHAIVMFMCKQHPINIQTNYYFDTDDLSMNRKGITCRIRAKDGKFLATIKSHGAEHPDCSIEEDLVEKTEFDSKIFDTIGLHHQGVLITERIVINKDSCCEIVLDRNTYLGFTDFELEVEYCEGGEARAQSLLESVAKVLVDAKILTGSNVFLKRVGQGKSKSQRFFESKIEGR